VFIFVNFSFSLFTPPPLGDYHLAFFSFSLLTLECFVSEARDTNCVVILVGSK
jgi:hypothetical protein